MKKKRLIRLPYHTSKAGWLDAEGRLMKSAKANRQQPCNKINLALHKKLSQARDAYAELVKEMRPFDVDVLVHYIELMLSGVSKDVFENRKRNSLTLKSWMSVIVQRMTARWYEEGVAIFLNFLQKEDLPMAQLRVTDLNAFVHFQQAKGNVQNTISGYLRAIRALYN